MADPSGSDPARAGKAGMPGRHHADSGQTEAPPARASSGLGPRTRPPVEEPVWLVRTVLVLFLVGFAVFLAREVRYAIDTFP